MATNPTSVSMRVRKALGYVLSFLLAWGLIALAQAWDPLEFPRTVYFGLLSVLAVVVLFVAVGWLQRPDRFDEELATIRRCYQTVLRLLALLDPRLPPPLPQQEKEFNYWSSPANVRRYAQQHQLSYQAGEVALPLLASLQEGGNGRLDTLLTNLVHWLRVAPPGDRPTPSIASAATPTTPAGMNAKRQWYFCASRWPNRADWMRGMVIALFSLVFLAIAFAITYAIVSGVEWLTSSNWGGGGWGWVLPAAGLLYVWLTLDSTFSSHRGEHAEYLNSQITGAEHSVDVLGMLLDRRIPEEVRKLSLTQSDYLKFRDSWAAWTSAPENASSTEPSRTPWWHATGTEARLQLLVEHLETQDQGQPGQVSQGVESHVPTGPA